MTELKSEVAGPEDLTEDPGRPTRGKLRGARRCRPRRARRADVRRPTAYRPRHSQLASSGADEYSAPVATRPKRVATMRIGNTKWHERAAARRSVGRAYTQRS
jgi:hypothetical protein